MLATRQDPGTGKPFGADLPAIADNYLVHNEPQDGETVMIFVDGMLYGASPDPPYDLSGRADLVRQWTTGPSNQYGEVTGTPAGPARWLAVPVEINGEVHGQLVVAQFTAERSAEIDQAVQVMALASGLVFLVVAAGGYLGMGRALRPLRAVTETARTIEERDLSRRIQVTGTDEVAVLARTFNAMVERLERAFATQQAFLSDIGHELRTPITIVRGHLELMGDDPAERRETVALVTGELDRMNRMVDDLLMLARAEQPDFLQPAPVDVPAMMAEVAAKATALGPRDWQLAGVPPVTVRADQQRLTQALTQLVQNAVQVTGDGDRIVLSGQLADGTLYLRVRDSGPGIDRADRDRIFTRFARGATGHARADGAGLGLAIVSAVANAHRGTTAT